MDVEDGDTLSMVDPSEDDDVDNATPNDVDIGSDSQDGDSDSESDIDSKREVEDLEWKFFSKDDTKDDAQDLEGVSRDKFKLKLVPAFDNMSCLSYLFLFLPVSFFKHIAFQTNLYAAQEKKKMAAEAPQIVGRHWYETDQSEVMIFFAIMMTMGIIGYAGCDFYWAGGIGVASNVSFFNCNLRFLMPKYRYQQLKRYLHLSDNTSAHPRGHVNHDRLYKVRPLLDLLSVQFAKHVQLGSMVAVDESMIPFKGNTYWRQYCKDKPIKWGIKLFCLCCSETGYFHSFRVYAGKGSVEFVHGLCTDSVMTLVDASDVKPGSIVFTDR